MKADSNQTWYALDLTIEAQAHEAVEYALMEAGALGTETNEDLVTAYFDRLPNREQVREQLADALRIYELPSSSVRDMQFREVANRDWLGEWKKGWQPVELGRLIIAPPWSEIKTEDDHVVVRIEPGMAFGTGTHETTRLCLKAILRFFKGGSFLDVGTGTGILAIAAAKLFPEARVTACDTDADAIEIARENARQNGIAGQIDFRVGSILDVAPSADFVCANLTADVISSMLPDLLSATCGRLVLSGILETQADDIIARLPAQGAAGNLVVLRDGEWVALVL
ncbi:MAG TPA: 50S ribosomal protein L11 methyltransferase [Pyrinomonadaceae bacterium]|nr:50S ribosomal protein L11 methyltransferase [Pyrinomonadaceae bacterium]